MKKGILAVISGPSGTGKGTIVHKLIDKGYSEVSVSCTTRSPREGEIEGKSYFFKSVDEFKSMIYDDAFIEYAQVFGNYYGTPKDYVTSRLNAGINVILEIDVQGAMQIKKNNKDAVLIFILPPSMQELYNRLAGRGTETADVIKKRYNLAKSEIKYAEKYDYIVVNDDLDEAVEVVNSILESSKYSALNNNKIDELLNEEGVKL